MKDAEKEDLERGRPDIPAKQAVEFCLERLYEDKTRFLCDRVVGGLWYEELIGALLLARDSIEELEKIESAEK